MFSHQYCDIVHTIPKKSKYLEVLSSAEGRAIEHVKDHLILCFQIVVATVAVCVFVFVFVVAIVAAFRSHNPET